MWKELFSEQNVVLYLKLTVLWYFVGVSAGALRCFSVGPLALSRFTFVETGSIPETG